MKAFSTTFFRSVAVLLPVLAFAMGVAHGSPLLPCTQEEQSNCVVANPGGAIVITESYINDPTFVDTSSSQRVDQYQTTLTALLNGGTTVYQGTFAAPFSDSSVQDAIQADALLSMDGATFTNPVLTSTATTLQSSQLSYVATSPILDPLIVLDSCGIALGATGTCFGVTVTQLVTTTVTFGPETVMIGLNQSDEFYIADGQQDININADYTYIVDRNAITTSTYMTTQPYEIDGTTGASSVPEPRTWALMLAGLGVVWLGKWKRVSARWGILSVLALAIGLAHGSPLLPCTGTGLVAQEEQSNCIIANPGESVVVPASSTNDPTFVDTPSSQRVEQYQTTLMAVVNGATTIFQETFDAPFNDPSVQNAISQADALLSLGGNIFSGPLLTSTSTTLQSSAISYVPTSPVLDLVTLNACQTNMILYAGGPAASCSGVTVSDTENTTVTYGPATIMIGPSYSDVFFILSAQEDINLNSDFTYIVDRNAITTNTYLTTQTYEIAGTTGASSVPEPGTWGTCSISLAGLGAIWLGKRKKGTPSATSRS